MTKFVISNIDIREKELLVINSDKGGIFFQRFTEPNCEILKDIVSNKSNFKTSLRHTFNKHDVNNKDKDIKQIRQDMKVQDAKHLKDIKSDIQIKMNKNLRGQEKKQMNNQEDLNNSDNQKNHSLINFSNLDKNKNEKQDDQENLTLSSSFHVSRNNSNIKIIKSKNFDNNLKEQIQQSSSSDYQLNQDTKLKINQINNSNDKHIKNNGSAQINLQNNFEEIENQNNIKSINQRPKTTNSQRVSHLNTGETKKVHTSYNNELSKSPPKYYDDNKLKNIPSSFIEQIKPKNVYHQKTHSGKGSRPNTSNSYDRREINSLNRNNENRNDNNLLKFQTTKCKQGSSIGDQIKNLGFNTTQKQSLQVDMKYNKQRTIMYDVDQFKKQKLKYL